MSCYIAIEYEIILHTSLQWLSINKNLSLNPQNFDGILPKGHYPPCLRMADRALWQNTLKMRSHSPWPNEQAMGPLLWGFWRKLTVLQWHHTALDFFFGDKVNSKLMVTYSTALTKGSYRFRIAYIQHPLSSSMVYIGCYDMLYQWLTASFCLQHFFIYSEPVYHSRQDEVATTHIINSAPAISTTNLVSHNSARQTNLGSLDHTE